MKLSSPCYCTYYCTPSDCWPVHRQENGRTIADIVNDITKDASDILELTELLKQHDWSESLGCGEFELDIVTKTPDSLEVTLVGTGDSMYWEDVVTATRVDGAWSVEY